MDPGWIMASIALATTVTGLSVWIARSVWRVLSRVTRFLDDFFGEPAMGAQPAKPGVMQRLSQVETKINSIAAEVHPNSGGSLRDDVVRIVNDVREIRSDVNRLSDQVGRIRK